MKIWKLVNQRVPKMRIFFEGAIEEAEELTEEELLKHEEDLKWKWIEEITARLKELEFEKGKLATERKSLDYDLGIARKKKKK